MKYRRWVALTVLAGLTFAVVAGAVQFRDHFQGPNPNFWSSTRPGTKGSPIPFRGRKRGSIRRLR